MEKHLLYGIGETENIVAIEPIMDSRGNDTHYRMYIRVNSATVRETTFKHTPFVYVKSSALESIRVPSDINQLRLNGTQPFNVRLSCVNYRRLKSFVSENLEKEDVYEVSRGDQPYITSGETLFKGMTFDTVKRLYFDIETITTKGYKFSNADRAGDAIIIISILITYKKEEEYIMLRLDEYESEKDMLREFVMVIRQTNPDVIIGHNIYNFDLPFIQKRLYKYGLELNIGRNGAAPYTYETTMSFADKKANYTNWHVYGRHVLDTMYMAMKVDVVKRDLPSYNLKDLAVYLGVASKDRHYLEGANITSAWFNENGFDREFLCKYAKDDVYETRALDKAFGQSFFYSSQFLPCSYQDAFRLGSGSRITALFLREYYRKNHSIPQPEQKREYGGGFSGYATSGHITNVAVGIDIESMYPTLGEELKLQPKNDELGIYQDILKLLKRVRLDTKYKKMEYKEKGDKELFEVYNSQDGAFKIYLNTMSYGSLADEFNPFNDYDCAESITTNGRRVLKYMMVSIESHAGRICKWDTDGILVVIPEEYIGREKDYLDLIQADLTAAIDTGLYDGFYDSILEKYEQFHIK